MEHIEIYTDGACLGNPGPGGWGVLLKAKNTQREIYGGVSKTTNNQMELTAVIKALELLNELDAPNPIKATIYTDSQYVQKGITTWIHNWKKNGWKTSSRKPVKNADLWRRLDELAGMHDITWEWVKGHAGHPDNERVDALACQAADIANREKK